MSQSQKSSNKCLVSSLGEGGGDHGGARRQELQHGGAHRRQGGQGPI